MKHRFTFLVLAVIALLGISLVAVPLAGAQTRFYVHPTRGTDATTAGSSTRPYRTLNYALTRVPCGATVELASNQTYAQDVTFNRTGCVNHPSRIVVTGNRSARFIGSGSDAYIFEIRTGNLQLDDFTIDGQQPNGSFRQKLIFTSGTGVTRLEISRMALRNALTECVRLRFGASFNIIRDNQFQNCGRGGTNNGESIYIGTDRSQWQNGVVEASTDNQVLRNTFNLNISNGTGSECVNIKEGSMFNIVEGNTCTGQRDVNSGGIEIRGTNNIVRNNTVRDNRGAGIQLGFGDDRILTDGTNNIVRGNVISNNGLGSETRAFGLRIRTSPQTLICGNTFTNNRYGNVGGEDSAPYVTTAGATCP
jgi:parallel beta-helix repeat protein